MNCQDLRSSQLAGMNLEGKALGFFGHVTQQVSGSHASEALKPPQFRNSPLKASFLLHRNKNDLQLLGITLYFVSCCSAANSF
jgi:hypothetical protein